MKNLKDIIKDKDLTKDTRNTHEFQAYANRLADELNDPKHRALYIKLAKNEDRNLLEEARAFVLGQKDIETPGRLFMWKLSELKKAREDSFTKENK